MSARVRRDSRHCKIRIHRPSTHSLPLPNVSLRHWGSDISSLRCSPWASCPASSSSFRNTGQSAANAGTFDKSSVSDYSDAILNWWRTNGGSMPAWAIAARIVFCISPNSASRERIFTIVNNLFGDEQLVRRSRITSVRHSCSITMTMSLAEAMVVVGGGCA